MIFLDEMNSYGGDSGYYYTTQEFGKKYGLPQKTIYNWIQKKQITGVVKIGRQLFIRENAEVLRRRKGRPKGGIQAFERVHFGKNEELKEDFL